MNKDLTVGDPRKVLWAFCLPLFGSVIFQQLYNLADSFVAGKFIGENALAAVGNSYEITLVYIAFGFGCNMGCSVIVSRFFGAKEYDKVKTTVSTSWISSAAICAMLMILGLVFGQKILGMINTPPEIMADSVLYLNIYTLGLPFLIYYNIANGIFSALGDSRTPFIFLSISSVSNIFVDILFVAQFKMGVAGVAWATFICQGVSCILAMAVVMRRMKGIRTEKRVPLFSAKILHMISKIAIPSILQQGFISLGNIVIQSVINGFGAGAIAGYAAGVKLNNLVITSYTTIGNGVSNYTAQNLGAEKPERAKAGLGAGLRLVWVLTIPLALLYFFAGGSLVRFFINEPTELAVHTGMIFLRILSPFYFVVSAKLVSDGVLRGAGSMNEFMVSAFLDLILRVALAIILSKTFLGCTGIWCAWPVGWSIATVLSFWFYHRGNWAKKTI